MSRSLARYHAQHFLYEYSGKVATITLNRPDRKNPLTFDSYAELRDLFQAMSDADDVKAIVLTGGGENFCSGGDVHEIIGPLTEMDNAGLLSFTQMTGDLVKAMRACPQPIIAAVDGIGLTRTVTDFTVLSQAVAGNLAVDASYPYSAVAAQVSTVITTYMASLVHKQVFRPYDLERAVAGAIPGYTAVAGVVNFQVTTPAANVVPTTTQLVRISGAPTLTQVSN